MCNYLVICNDLVLIEIMLFILICVVSIGLWLMGIEVVFKVIGVEDFFFFQCLILGLFFFVGVMLLDIELVQVYFNYLLCFIVDECGLEVGVCVLVNFVVDYFVGKQVVQGWVWVVVVWCLVGGDVEEEV